MLAYVIVAERKRGINKKQSHIISHRKRFGYDILVRLMFLIVIRTLK